VSVEGLGRQTARILQLMAFKAKMSVEGLEPSTNGLKGQREKYAHFVQELTKLGGVHWMDKTTSLLDGLIVF
jgi:hypothetical protein